MDFVILVLFIIIIYQCFPYLPFEYFVTGKKDPVISTLHQQLRHLHPKLQNIKVFKGNKSYTLNKSVIYICLKDKHGKYYNRNMLCYVLIHEYAHVLCKSIGHTEEFYSIFANLLQKAAQRKMYDPSIPPLDDYCGH